jgi:phosphohistidine phosphatase
MTQRSPTTTGPWRRAVAAPLRSSPNLQRKGIAPELVLCSRSRRTRQTLTRIAPSLGETADVQIRPELYAASAADLLEVLREAPDGVDSVMLIGHNPGIQDLALSLARSGTEIARVSSKFPTAALATLEFRASWRELAPRTAELVSFVKPKELSRGGAGEPSAGMPG